MLLRRTLVALALGALLTPAARADKRLDQAQAKAEAQLAKGKEDEAVKILQKAAAQAATDAAAQLALAQMLARVGRLAEAASAFEEAGRRASAAAPGVRASVFAARSAFALRAGTSRDALALAQQALAAQPGAETEAALARALARRGDPEAVGHAEHAVATTPDSAMAQLARGDVALGQRLGELAEPAYRRALELRPGWAEAASGLALALAARGKAAEALEAARAACRFDAHLAEAEAALGLAALAQDPADKASEAIAAVQQARFLEPESPPVRLALGRVFAARGQLEQAASAYAEAARLDPTWSAPRVAELELRLRQGDAKGALAELQALPEELRVSGEAQLLLGRLLLRQGDARGGETALATAVAVMPGSAEAQAEYGDAAYEAVGVTAAASALEQALKRDPGNLGYRLRFGRFAAYDGRPADALPVLLEVTGRAEGRTAEAFLTLGLVYRSFEPPRVAEAVAAYQEALKLEPRNAEAALGVARSYRAGKQWARAVEAYERVAAQHRKLDAQAQLGIAWCYYRSGDSYKAAFYTGLAARAGADVSALREALGKPVWAADELDELLDQLHSRQAGEQSRAVRGLARLGRTGMPHLLSTLQRRTTALGVRQTVVAELRRLGPGAQEALPVLERLIAAGPLPASDGRHAEEETRLVDAMREAVAAIRAR